MRLIPGVALQPPVCAILFETSRNVMRLDAEASGVRQPI